MTTTNLREAAQTALDALVYHREQTRPIQRTNDAIATLRAALAAQATPQPLVLMGIGKINGDGWKDTTRIGEVVYAWNRPMPEPYAPGQFPRVGYPIWSASTMQYDFRPVADDEAITVIDRTIEEMRMELATLKDRASGIGAGQVAPTDALRDVAAERRRQIEAEGWTPGHDDEHDNGTLAAAGCAYALAAADSLHPMSRGDGDFMTTPPLMWPWEREWWKPGDARRMLVKAGALVLAEIERLDRAAGL